MTHKQNTFMNKLSQSNVMPDGMLYPVKYGELSMAMFLKNKPPDERPDPRANQKEFR